MELNTKRARMLRDALPFPPCETDGKEPFIAVLFADPELDAAVRAIKVFRELGHNVWFDTSASGEMLFSGETRDAISNCGNLVFIYEDSSLESEYYLNAYMFVRRIHRRHFTLHMQGYSINSIERGEIPYHCVMKTDDGELREQLKYLFWHGHENERPCLCDDGSRFDPALCFEMRVDGRRQYITVNLRIHEAWDGDRVPQGVLTHEQILGIPCDGIPGYELLPVSYSADYSETAADSELLLNRALKRAEELEKKARLEEAKRRWEAEERAKREAYYRTHAFPPGYPDMDEFEYIGSDGDE